MEHDPDDRAVAISEGDGDEADYISEATSKTPSTPTSSIAATHLVAGDMRRPVGHAAPGPLRRAAVRNGSPAAASIAAFGDNDRQRTNSPDIGLTLPDSTKSSTKTSRWATA
jgi:hypothetical protein